MKLQRSLTLSLMAWALGQGIHRGLRKLYQL